MKKFKEENKQDEQTEKQTHKNISGNKRIGGRYGNWTEKECFGIKNTIIQSRREI